jgi:hypothetical protein
MSDTVLYQKELLRMLLSSNQHPISPLVFKSDKQLESLLNYSFEQGVLYLLLAEINRQDIGIPPTVKQWAQRLLALQELWGTHVANVHDEIVSTLHQSQLRTVSLKGVSLARRLYENPVLRPCSDIDILICPEDLDLALPALAKIGYRFSSKKLNKFLRINHHNLQLVRGNDPMLELHFRLYSGFGVHIPAAPFINRAVAYRDDFVLSKVDELFYLIVHATGHFFSRLGWVVDIARLLSAETEESWKQVVQLGSTHGLQRALGFGMDHLARMGLDIPASTFPNYRSLAWLIADPAQGEHDDIHKRIKSLVFRSLLCDTPQRSINFFVQRIFQESQRFYTHVRSNSNT